MWRVICIVIRKGCPLSMCTEDAVQLVSRLRSLLAGEAAVASKEEFLSICITISPLAFRLNAAARRMGDLNKKGLLIGRVTLTTPKRYGSLDRIVLSAIHQLRY